MIIDSDACGAAAEHASTRLQRCLAQVSVDQGQSTRAEMPFTSRSCPWTCTRMLCSTCTSACCRTCPTPGCGACLTCRRSYSQLLMDFLTDSYNVGGVISILALHGLFVLINQHHLCAPRFTVHVSHVAATIRTFMSSCTNCSSPASSLSNTVPSFSAWPICFCNPRARCYHR